jgi:hypothetical protein
MLKSLSPLHVMLYVRHQFEANSIGNLFLLFTFEFLLFNSGRFVSGFYCCQLLFEEGEA